MDEARTAQPPARMLARISCSSSAGVSAAREPRKVSASTTLVAIAATVKKTAVAFAADTTVFAVVAELPKVSQPCPSPVQHEQLWHSGRLALLQFSEYGPHVSGLHGSCSKCRRSESGARSSARAESASRRGRKLRMLACTMATRDTDTPSRSVNAVRTAFSTGGVNVALRMPESTTFCSTVGGAATVDVGANEGSAAVAGVRAAVGVDVGAAVGTFVGAAVDKARAGGILLGA